MRLLLSIQFDSSRARTVRARAVVALAAIILLSQLSSAFGLSVAHTKAIHGRAVALQTLLSLDSTQTDSLEVILRQTFERGNLNRESFDDDYYALALENLREMDSMRSQVDAILSPGQREKYLSSQKKQPKRYSSRKTEVLARRLLLDSSQTLIVDAILSYSEQDIMKIRHESKRRTSSFTKGLGSVSERSSMMRTRSKLIKSHDAIEKILTKAQKKEFKDYRKEQMDMFRPSGEERERNGRF